MRGGRVLALLGWLYAAAIAILVSGDSVACRVFDTDDCGLPPSPIGPWPSPWPWWVPAGAVALAVIGLIATWTATRRTER